LWDGAAQAKERNLPKRGEKKKKKKKKKKKYCDMV
jgi:hypothetical protein